MGSPSVNVSYLFSVLGEQEHGHVSAVQLRSFVDGTNLSAAFCKILEKLFADLGVSHFSAAETDGHLDSVAVFEELDSALEFDIEVIGTDAWRHSDFLDLDNFLVLLSLLLALGLFEAELAVVHDAANRGLCLGCDLYQIEVSLGSDLEGALDGDDAQLRTVGVNQAYFLVVDLFIDLMLLSANAETPPKKLKKERQKYRP